MSNKRKIVVFAPHPDDETFGCGGTIAKKINEGHEVYVVVMTDGRYAFRNVLGIHNLEPEELKSVREREVKNATKILGIGENRLIFLDFVDGTLMENKELAKEKVIKILEKLSPDEVYVPYKRDGHSDHRATYQIVSDSIKKLNKRVRKYQYQITHKFARVGPILENLINFITGKRLCFDISDFLSVKELAINAFKSEITVLSGKQKRPVICNVKKFLKDKEVFFVEE